MLRIESRFLLFFLLLLFFFFVVDFLLLIFCLFFFVNMTIRINMYLLFRSKNKKKNHQVFNIILSKMIARNK